MRWLTCFTAHGVPVGAAPPGLAGKRLISLDVAALVAGSAYRGEFEARLTALLKDVEGANGEIILFIGLFAHDGKALGHAHSWFINNALNMQG